MPKPTPPPPRPVPSVKPRTTDLVTADLRIDANILDRAGMPEIAARVREAIIRLEAATIPMTYGFIGQSVGKQSAVYVQQLYVGSRWLAGLIGSGEVDVRRGFLRD